MPITPQKNGVVEGQNGTLIKTVRSMVNNCTLPVSLWMYALMTTPYLLNRVPSKVVYKTPYELCTRMKPSCRHLHVWSCQAEVRMHKPHENKLDSITINGYFFGYLERFKGYMFYFPNQVDHTLRYRFSF